jgi:hypothetical protein
MLHKWTHSVIRTPMDTVNIIEREESTKELYRNWLGLQVAVSQPCL